nr:L,D-transpeptidase family protein [Flammeovirgaceae bacterium]
KILGAYNNINPENYNAQAGLIAQTEEAFTKAFFQLSQINLYGYVTPSDVPAVAWHLPSRNRNFVSALDYAIDNDNIHSALLSILPQNPEYEALIHFKNKYEIIAENGGWPTLPEEITKLELGDTSSNILVLRMRLIITDDLARQYEDGLEYDENVAIAVSHYQKRNGLLVDGRIGKNTLENLNVPVEDRLKQLLVNIERYKWLPENQGEKFIWVNIPDYTLQYVEYGQVVREHVVVTGAKKHQTPCFNSYIKNVVLNPYWNVPYSITKDEIAPKLSEDAEYLLNKNYEVLNGWGKNNVLEPGEELNLKSGNYRVRQKPGPGNALGRVKFNLPNNWSIYLHDTPSKSYFQRTHRAYSHGCVRVKDPRDLAAAVLNSSGDWNRSEIDEVINSGATKEIGVKDHVNVYIVYMTAFIDSDGNLQLREDVYGRDREINNALSQI